MRLGALSWCLVALSACAVGLPEEGEMAGEEASFEPWDDGLPPPEVAGEETADVSVSEAGGVVRTIAACGDAKLADVLAPATEDRRSVAVDCDLTLRASDVVTKQLILQGAAASGVTVDCRGALLDGANGRLNDGRDMIEIRSRKVSDGVWERPEGVTVRNCRINGSLRVYGMGKNGEAVDVRDSSRQAGHSTRVRDNAPRRVLLDNLTITGSGRTNLYLSPGVTEVTLINSELTGEATSAGLYLDTESARNVIRNNYLHVTSRKEYVGGIYTRKREEIAVDGSSDNRIFDNRLSSLEGGGIYLYRNCGEGGTVRHTPPQRNQIINNIFYYNEYDGDNPAIYLGSRDNDFWEFRWYCGDDDGYDWGSSADDRSFARYNVVMQNQIVKRSVSDMIQQGDDSNQPNTLGLNQSVTTETVRPAGCYVATGYKTFIHDGESLDVWNSGGPRCTGVKQTCDDGVLVRGTAPDCGVERVVVDCQISNNNAGCQKTAACPAGKRIVGAVAACNLEYGTVSDASLAAMPVGTVSVVVASDHTSDGSCWVGGNRVASGRTAVANILDQRSVTVGCKEHDKNGGDCHIKTALYCR